MRQASDFPKKSKSSRRFLFSLVLILGLGLVSGATLLSSRSSESPHSENGEDLQQLKQRMRSLENSYLNLSVVTQMQAFDFKEVKKQLTGMESNLLKIRAVNTRPSLENAFDQLAGQLNHLNKWIQQENPVQFRKQLEETYQLCFQCHSTHAPSKKSNI